MIISKGNPQPFPELRGKLAGMRFPAYVEPKIDGELNWFLPTADLMPPCLINKSGKMRFEIPCVLELYKMNIDHKLLGELHWGDGKSGALYEFLKHQDDDELRFTVFDVDMPGTYIERHVWLARNISNTQHVSLIKQHVALDQGEALREYHRTIKNGYEGIVIKPADSRLIMGPCAWVKMKHRELMLCRVSSISPDQERIEVNLNSEIASETRFIDKSSCGVKCAEKVKKTLKVGDLVEIEHQGVLSKGGLRHPVYIRKVGEK